MVSELRKAAARANGAKSRGPKTEAGKRRSSQNSLKHGMYASAFPVPGESPELLAESVASFMEALRPQTPEGRALVQIMATAGRLRTRLDEWEVALLNREIDRQIASHPELDPATHASLAFRALAPSGVLAFINQYGSRFDRRIGRALAILLKQRIGQRLTVRDRSNLNRLLLQHPEIAERTLACAAPGIQTAQRVFPEPDLSSAFGPPPLSIEIEERTKPTPPLDTDRLTPVFPAARRIQSA